MATVGGSYLNLADLRRQQHRDDEIADIIEIMAQRNDMLADAPVVECNSGFEHLTTIRSGLPEPTWRRLYEGVQPTKGTTTQVTDATGYMEDWSEIDAQLVERAKNPQKFRMNEAKAHIMGISHALASTVIYGNTATEPEKFDGLAVRYGDTQAANGNQIVDAGGTGSDNTSVWFITWGEETCHFLYPEDTELGIKREDKGKTTKEKSDGTLYDVFREKFSQHAGLSVRDWREVVRIANIDVSALTDDAASGADLINLMIDAYYQLDNPGARGGNVVIYAGRTVAKFLHKQAMNEKNVRLSIEQYGGAPIPMFLGHPIRRMDAILETEAQVT
jgi:hypothetical protein